MKNPPEPKKRSGGRIPEAINYQSETVKGGAFPAAGTDTVDKESGTEAPVNNHGNPSAEHSHTKRGGKKEATDDAEKPHGNHRNNHGKAHIVCGTQGIRKREGQRPNQAAESAVQHKHLASHCHGFGRKIVGPKNKRYRKQDQEIRGYHDCVANHH